MKSWVFVLKRLTETGFPESFIPGGLLPGKKTLNQHFFA